MAVSPHFRATDTRGRIHGRVSVRLLGLALLVAPSVLLPRVAKGARGPLPAATGSLAVSPQFTIRLAYRLEPELGGRQIVTLAEARHSFGPPRLITRRPGTPVACAASWPALGLVIDFSASNPTSCARQELGSWVEIVARARRWHTQAGLHVADSEQRVHSLYPDARSLDFLGSGRAWQLETGGPLCDGGPPLSLAALIGNHHVQALAVLRVPACG